MIAVLSYMRGVAQGIAAIDLQGPRTRSMGCEEVGRKARNTGKGQYESVK
jgi:hypothetical protein